MVRVLFHGRSGDATKLTDSPRALWIFLRLAETLAVAAPADFHVHLRRGKFAELVGKHISEGSFGLACVMMRIAELWLDAQNLIRKAPVHARMTAKLGATN